MSVSTSGRMLILVRCVAASIVLLVVWQAAWLAFMAASFEPSRPLPTPLIWTLVFASLGLVSGHALVAAMPVRIATAGVVPRSIVLLLILIPCVAAVYLLLATHVNAVAGACLLLIGATAWLASACIWPAWLGRSRSD